MTPDKNPPLCTSRSVRQDMIEEVASKLPITGSINAMAELFKCLADPTRLKIIHALLIRELCVCELGQLLDMSPQAISHHLKILRVLRLVKFRRSGKIVYYNIADNHIVQILLQALAHVEE